MFCTYAYVARGYIRGAAVRVAAPDLIVPCASFGLGIVCHAAVDDLLLACVSCSLEALKVKDSTVLYLAQTVE